MKRDIIIYLITQEFKYHHFIFQLEKAGLIYEDNTISLLEVFQPILGIKENGIGNFPLINDKLGDCYQKRIDEAIQTDEESLMKLVEQCFNEIDAIINHQN